MDSPASHDPDSFPPVIVSSSWCEAVADPAFSAALSGFLNERRWFAGKARGVAKVTIREHVPLATTEADTRFLLVLFEVAYATGPAETYLLPVRAATAHDSPADAICRWTLRDTTQSGLLIDAAADPALWTELLQLITSSSVVRSHAGRLSGAITARCVASAGDTIPRVQSRQQSHSSAIFAPSLLLKLFRRVATGRNPELEIGEFLSHVSPPAPVPALLGWLEYRRTNGEEFTLGVLQAFVPNEGDAWTHTLQSLGIFCSRVKAVSLPPPLPATVAHLFELARSPASLEAFRALGDYGPAAEWLGRRTGELHVALASRSAVAAFAPATSTMADQRELYHSVRDTAVRSLDLLTTQLPHLPPHLQDVAKQVLRSRESILSRFAPLVARKINSQRIRVHGDYHLGQVLFTGSDFVIIDFEGEPDRPVAERRQLRSPLRDVAGMLRSFHYACHTDTMGLIPGVHRDTTADRRQWLDAWYVWTAAAFLRGYLQATAGRPWLPDDAEELRWLLEVSLLEKLVYELAYELNSRPDWAGIPLAALVELDT